MIAEYIVPNEETISKIRAGDIEVRNRYFMENYTFFRSACRSCILRKLGHFSDSDIDELLSECYLHLPEMDLQRRDFLITSIYDQLLFARFGGKRAYYRDRLQKLPDSLDSPVYAHSRSGEAEDKGETLGDFLPAPDFMELYGRNSAEERVYSLLNVLKEFLTPREFEVMQFRLCTGLSAQEIGKEIGRTKGAVLSQMCTAHKNMVLHYHEILLRLSSLGFTHCIYYLKQGVIPSDFEEVQDFYERRRERGRERARKKYSDPIARAEKNARQRARRAKQCLTD